MGNEIAKNRGTREERAKNAQISKNLKRDFSLESQIIKLLVLGAGESGKSTIVKQMKLIHPTDGRKDVGFSMKERMDARKAIYLNIIESMTNLIDACRILNIKEFSQNENRAIDFVYNYADILSEHQVGHGSHQYNQSTSNEIPKFDTSICPTKNHAKAFKFLWANKAIQEAYGRRNEFQLNDSTMYFMSDLDRICQPEFEPSEQDVLRSRVKTTGIIKIEFRFRNVHFQMFDVGGQRSERKKWIHCFDNVTAVLFVISIAEYDQVLEEDSSVNRMEESITLFSQILNNEFFELKPFIIFFNKKDLFEEKIKRKSIKEHFPDYTGPPHSFNESSQFFINKYTSQSRVSQEKRPMYPHLTTATDTNMVKFVFTTIAEIILNMVLDEYGVV